MASNVSELILRLRDEVSVAAKSSKASLEHLNRAVESTIASASKASQAMFQFKGGWEPTPQLRLAREELQLLNPQLIGYSGSVTGAAQAQTQFLTSARPLGTALSFAASQAGVLGPAANIASNAIVAMAVQSGPAGLALGALAATIGILASRIQTARDRFRELSERELAGLAKETRGLGIEQDIRGRIKLLDTQGDKIRELAVQADQFRVKMGKEGVEPGRIEQLLSSQFANVLKEEIASISRMDAVTAINTLLRKENALAAAQQAGESGKVVAALKQEIIAAQERISQIDRAEEDARGGKAGGTFLQQLSTLGKKVQESLLQPIGPVQIAEFKGAIEGLGEAAIQKWGFEVPAIVQASMSKVSAQIDQLALLKQITPIEINAEQPFRELAAIQAKGEALRAFYANNPIIIRTKVETEGSPTLPFSDYFGPGGYAEKALENFSDRAPGLTFDSNFSSAIVGALNEIIKAKEQLAQAIAFRPFGASMIGDFSVGPAARLRALQDTLGFLQGMGTRSAAPGGGPSTISGQGGGNTFVIDLRGAHISQELLDRQLVPRFEAVIRAATGKNVDYRVFN